LIVLDQRDLGLSAERLFVHAEAHASKLPPWPAAEAQPLSMVPDTVLAGLAAQELRCRSRRSRHLPSALFGGGGWEILLELFISEQSGGRTSLSSVCVASQVAKTTAIRYIAFMVADGLVQRVQDPGSLRNKAISLTPKGIAATRTALQESVYAAD